MAAVAAVIFAIAAAVGWYEAIQRKGELVANAVALDIVTRQKQALTQQVSEAQTDLAAAQTRRQALNQQVAQSQITLERERAEYGNLQALQQRIEAAKKAAAAAEQAKTEAAAPSDATPSDAAPTDSVPQPRPSPAPPGDASPVAGNPAVSPPLPGPDLPDTATFRDYLVAAREALKAGHLGVAQTALERAEVRLLNLASLTPGASPTRHPGIMEIETALDALDSGRTEEAVNALDGLLEPG